MSSILDNAIVYDIESFPNVFTFSMECLNNDQKAVWEISDFRNDSRELMQFLFYCSSNGVFQIGFNNLLYDYPMIDWLIKNSNATAQQIRAKNDQLFECKNDFKKMIWPNDRLIPQIDLRSTHHFTNKAKMQSLKGLQINMRSPNVVEMDLGFERNLTASEVEHKAIPYNHHDVSETKKFAIFSLPALRFREDLIPQHGVEVMNWNDTKIGEEIIVKRLGDDICFDRSSGRKQKRQTPRYEIKFNDIIFPYIEFKNPEFIKVLNELRSKTIKASDVDIDEDGIPGLKTKGVFKGLNAVVGGVKFVYGVGGIHGSVERKKIISNDTYMIRDIDVASLYPSIAIVNRLSPEHLGSTFSTVYSQLPTERKEWQKKKGKKCVEANSIKLAANGAFGKSNSKFSVLFDPQFTMTITINGQLLLSMLIEKLNDVPTLQFIQANTDGITYYIKRDHVNLAEKIEKEWQDLTKLVLEDVEYNRMFVRDVNSYIAEEISGELKCKGAYWTPDPLNWHDSISNAQPPAWHKNLSNPISTRAALAYMLYDVDVDVFLGMCRNPYDFTLSVKVTGKNKLLHGEIEQHQKNNRYYISKNGQPMFKRMTPKGKLGTYVRKQKVKQEEYLKVMEEVNWQWDERVCSKNQSVYRISNTTVNSGYKTTIVNDIEDFNFDDIDFNFYRDEAEKLIF